MDRVKFIGNVAGINYPEMVINFFDHFVALKQLVEDSGQVSVLNSDNESITFSITFADENVRKAALDAIYSLGGIIVIYERPITIKVEIPTDNHSIIIKLI